MTSQTTRLAAATSETPLPQWLAAWSGCCEASCGAGTNHRPRLARTVSNSLYPPARRTPPRRHEPVGIILGNLMVGECLQVPRACSTDLLLRELLAEGASFCCALITNRTLDRSDSHRLGLGGLLEHHGPRPLDTIEASAILEREIATDSRAYRSPNTMKRLNR